LRNGEERHVHLSAVLVFDDDSGIFRGYRGTGTDITLRVQSQKIIEASKARLEDTYAELRRRNEELRISLDHAKVSESTKLEFLAMMSHELKTPLNSIIGFSDAAIHQVHGPIVGPYASYFENIHTASRHLMGIITSLLDMASLDQPSPTIHPNKEAVEHLIEEAVQLADPGAHANELDLSGLLPKTDHMVYCDHLRARQILINLIGNAMKFTPAKGKIGIDVETRPENMVAITVWDIGIGIPSDKLPRIFEKFYQVEQNVPSRGGAGTGLGLSISRHLARLMGGDLAVTSIQGKGSRFYPYPSWGIHRKNCLKNIVFFRALWPPRGSKGTLWSRGLGLIIKALTGTHRHKIAYGSPMIDPFGRHISYLRVSVTDRCDFRCVYCMAEDMDFLPKAEVLTLEELNCLCSAFVTLGVRKLRITGGEPLVRKNIMQLLENLSRHLKTGDLEELTITTNGSQLSRYAADLARIGVRRINVSLDTLDREKFRAITRWGDLDKVLAGVEAAREAGLSVKVNVVALKGVNEDEYDAMIRWCGERGFDMTLIETMPLGDITGDRTDQYLPLSLVRANLERRWTLEDSEHRTGGPARYVRVAETGRYLGFITPLTHNFCESCNRVRLTCTGTLFMCLGQEDAADLRIPLRAGADDTALLDAIREAIARKPKGHDFIIDRRNKRPALARHMSVTGG